MVTGATLWLPSTAYTNPSSVVVNGSRVYRCNESGTSASSGGPAGTSSDITDGTAHWTHVTTNRSDTTSADGDIYLFDRRLMVAALKLAYQEEKGFDTTAALGRYQAALDAAKAADGAAPRLSFSPRPQFKLIDGSNVPDTGYGA